MRGTIWFQGFILSCLTIALPLAASAQPGDTDERAALQPGTWALQFGISDNFTLRSFEGSVLSVKRQMSERSAMRLGLSGTFENSDQDRFVSVADTVASRLDRQSDQVSLGLDLQYLLYADPAARVKFYYGAGPTFTWRTRSVETVSTSPSSGAVQQDEFESTDWQLGLSAVAGVEWFVTDTLSLHAEYGLEALYSSQHDENHDVTGNRSSETDDDGLFLNSRGVLFGLSAYF